MRLVRDKKGAELSMNVIVISILVILVLVVVAAFFLGGFAKLIDLITGVSPQEIGIVVSACSSNCQLAQSYDTENQKEKSDYCTRSWSLDGDGNGEVDTVGGDVKQYHCWDSVIGESCPGVREFCNE